ERTAVDDQHRDLPGARLLDQRHGAGDVTHGVAVAAARLELAVELGRGEEDQALALARGGAAALPLPLRGAGRGGGEQGAKPRNDDRPGGQPAGCTLLHAPSYSTLDTPPTPA